MAWALLGNELPDAPNKYMRFGAKWRKFSLAMDGIENGSIMRLRNAGGGYTPWTPSPIDPVVDPIGPGSGAAGKVGGKVYKAGFIATEVIGVIRLVGDIVSAALELFCINDLSVKPKKELEKQQAVTKLLDIKKGLYGRYSPMQKILDEMSKQASKVSGTPIDFKP
jgi:hypothetical protein